MEDNNILRANHPSKQTSELNNTGTDLNLNSNTDKIKEKLRPCCACPITKKLRDECIFEKGEEHCFEAIQKHNLCMKDLGFIVDESI